MDLSCTEKGERREERAGLGTAWARVAIKIPEEGSRGGAPWVTAAYAMLTKSSVTHMVIAPALSPWAISAWP